MRDFSIKFLFFLNETKFSIVPEEVFWSNSILLMKYFDFSINFLAFSEHFSTDLSSKMTFFVFLDFSNDTKL